MDAEPVAAMTGAPPDTLAADAAGIPVAAPQELVQVVFKGRRVEIFTNPDALAMARGARVIVEVERGIDLGEVLSTGSFDLHRRRQKVVRRILRLATPEEIARLDQVRGEDPAALRTVKDRVVRFGLPMHLVDAEYQLDGNRVTLYFTADHRIDFRELVRDLAAIFRTRIELRQINAREAARRLGGIGPCGRCICCCSVCSDFERVSLQTARTQRATCNPTRLSGACGRLLCCLAYEGPPCAVDPIRE